MLRNLRKLSSVPIFGIGILLGTMSAALLFVAAAVYGPGLDPSDGNKFWRGESGG